MTDESQLMPEKHAYEGNWPYEPCRVCGKQGLQGDADVHFYNDATYPLNDAVTDV